jgi:hypothetical protein
MERGREARFEARFSVRDTGQKSLGVLSEGIKRGR